MSLEQARKFTLYCDAMLLAMLGNYSILTGLAKTMHGNCHSALRETPTRVDSHSAHLIDGIQM